MSCHYYLCCNCCFKLLMYSKLILLKQTRTLYSLLIKFISNFPEYVSGGSTELTSLFSLFATVSPCIPLPSGPVQQLLSQERLHVLDCWVTFRGRLPLISKEAQHSGSWLQKEELWAGALWPAVSSWPQYGLQQCSPTSPKPYASAASSVRSEAPALGRLKGAGRATPEATQRENFDRNVTQCYQLKQKCPIMAVVFHEPEILSHLVVTQQLHSV